MQMLKSMVIIEDLTMHYILQEQEISHVFLSFVLFELGKLKNSFALEPWKGKTRVGENTSELQTS